MRRRVFNFLSALSLLVCVATGVVWVRSYWTADCFYRGTWERGDELHIVRGAIAVELRTMGHPSPEWRYFTEAASRVNATASDAGGMPAIRLLGFEYAPEVNLFAIPMWFPLVVTATVPAMYVVRRRRRRHDEAKCPCGYDLTGNVSGVCPECGTAVAGTTEGVA